MGRITSTGPAKKHRSRLMGRYKLLPGVKHNGKSVWEQENKKYKIFYSRNGYWFVGYPEKNWGGIGSVSSNISHPTMTEAWAYYEDSKWHTDDPTLSIKDPKFEWLRVTSTGPAKKHQSRLMGRYKLLPGVKHNGKSVWEQENK